MASNYVGKLQVKDDPLPEEQKKPLDQCACTRGERQCIVSQSQTKLQPSELDF